MPDGDLIATMPGDTAAAVAHHIKVSRLQHDPANRWLRGVFHAANRRDSS